MKINEGRVGGALRSAPGGGGVEGHVAGAGAWGCLEDRGCVPCRRQHTEVSHRTAVQVIGRRRTMAKLWLQGQAVGQASHLESARLGRWRRSRSCLGRGQKPKGTGRRTEGCGCEPQLGDGGCGGGGGGGARRVAVWGCTSTCALAGSTYPEWQWDPSWHLSDPWCTPLPPLCGTADTALSPPSGRT